MPRPLSRLAVVVALGTGLAGCGSGTDPPDVDVAGAPSSLFAAESASVEAGVDGRSIVARVEALPAEGATGRIPAVMPGQAPPAVRTPIRIRASLGGRSL